MCSLRYHDDMVTIRGKRVIYCQFAEGIPTQFIFHRGRRRWSFSLRRYGRDLFALEEGDPQQAIDHENVMIFPTKNAAFFYALSLVTPPPNLKTGGSG
jgi:hypothetical protein